MESSFLDHRGQFQVPPLHPLQYRKAREVLSDLGRARFTEFAEEIVSESWLGFYRNDGEISARYAISWAILWTLQDQMSGTHETRLLAVIGLKKDQIVARIPDVIEAITPSLSTQYRRYLESDRYRRWAIDQWLLDDRIDGRAILAAIEVEMVDSLASAWAWSRTTNLILRTRSRLDRNTRSELQQRIIEQLESGTMEVRQAICTAIPEYRWADQLIPALIELLETDRAELRAAAAAALSRISRHPTIVNPAFWISAAESDRSREIGEWRTWLDEN
jgi:DNA-binding transcriptional MerR regulator